MGKAVELIGAAQASGLRSVLRTLSDEVADLLLSELEMIAAGVASDARARVPRRSGAAQASYRATGAAVAYGGPEAPYVPWLEFGGKVGRKGSSGRGTVSRPVVKGGRYLYPAIKEQMADIEKRVDDLIEQASRGYLEVQ